MITGYISSDEDDEYDEYDFGYSEPLIQKRESPPPLLSVQNKELRERLHSALEHSKKVSLFLRAIDEEDLRTLEELIVLGVSVDNSGPEEWTPLMKACGNGKVEVVRFLLTHGSDCNLHKELFTPLMACCTSSLVEENLKLSCVRLLLEHGANVNATDKYRTTALMYSVESGYTEIVNTLLEVPHIEVNMVDKQGWSALFYAVDHNHIELVKKLVSAGCKLNFKDRYNRTVLNLALDRGFKEIAAVLGYVEEENIDLKENIYQSSGTLFLDELPTINGEGGFSSDAQNILQLFNQFKVKKINLPDFLNASDAQLYNLGVKLEHDRKKILKMGIHKYHLASWGESSMPKISIGIPMSLENSIAITGNLVKHLTIANASLRYLDKRISSRLNLDSVEVSLDKELINLLVSIFSRIDHTQLLLKRILIHISQIQPPSSSDFVQHFEKSNPNKILNKYVWCSLSITAVGCALFYMKLKRTL